MPANPENATRDTERVRSALRTIGGVRDARVVARRAGDRIALAAYVLTAEDACLTPASVRAAAEGLLADGMMPETWVIVDRLPRAESGGGAVGRGGEPGASASPRRTADSESRLAAIWSDVLRTDVSADSNFFELGGHSLLAARVMERIRHEFEVELPVRALFDAPTVAALARTLALPARPSAATIPPLRPVDPRPAVIPLSFQQQWLWHLYVRDTSFADVRLGVAFVLDGELDATALRSALTAVVTRHEGLRTNFAHADGADHQLIRPPAPFELPIADLGDLSGHRLEDETIRLGRAEWGRPFDLTADVMLRALLVRQTRTRHVLVLTRHFVASDGWSLGLILGELGALYDAAVDPARSPPLPPVTIQVADYALWQREQLAGAIETQLRYWTDVFRDGVPELHLPPEAQPPDGAGGAWLQQFLTEELSRDVRRICQREGATLFMFALAAFTTLLSAITGDEELVIGSDVANRSRPGTESLVGLVVNALAFRIDASGDPSFAQLLRRVRATVLEASEHQDAPFEHVFRLIPSVSTGPVRSPFRVMVTVQNFPRVPLALHGLDVTQTYLGGTPMGPANVDFDIELVAAETGGKIHLALACNSRRFGRNGSTFLMDGMRTVLAEAAAAPDRSVRTIAASVSRPPWGGRRSSAPR